MSRARLLGNKNFYREKREICERERFLLFVCFAFFAVKSYYVLRMNNQITDFIKHHYRHFNAAALIDAAEGYKKHLDAAAR